ncbi:MAG: hypothetical protein A3G34_07745 [Candidatus Lindowbacteria bacterium RIFCSPLOWO2_12_FULL_62_27]|nr:MAG: hypothetical protein A3G34_07745 [Candidatus Lindowbacteria bacterium RIFCSPLOWO2_12_FULL_62_27]OGH63824.1 MAG: hypothetical protein A3I06_04870 [Candidatus Lindowbacteria bacterium RIFCSPLOWO2_02_FULL_62_12]
MVRLTLKIAGRVQGVGFRWFVLDEAQRLGLVGYVRNLRNGCVEVLAEGDAESLAELERMCRQGPRSARVEAVEKSSAPVSSAGCTSFEIR